MKRDLGILDCSRILAALEAYADELHDHDDADKYRTLAEEIAGCDRVVIITIGPIE